MYQYFIFNIMFSILVFGYLYTLKSAPFRIRLRLVMLAMISWLIPYDAIFNYFNAQHYIEFSTGISAFNGSIKQSIIENVNTGTSLTLIHLVQILIIVGAIIFIKDLISLKRHLKAHSSQSILFKKLESIQIYQVNNSDNIFTVGYFQPKIYIGDQYINSSSLPSIIQHELQHIKNKDQIWLLIITFIQKLFWWNPIVYFLSNRARSYIELSCDEMCKNIDLDGSYQKDLAIILFNQHKSTSPLTSAFFGKSKLNIYRIKQLSEEFNMKKHHKAIIFLTAITPLLILPLVSTSSESNTKIYLDEDGEKIILNENQVDLTYKITIKNSDKNSTVNTRKVESRMIFEYDKKVSFGNDSHVFSSKEFQAEGSSGFLFDVEVNKVDDNSIMVNAIVEFNINGEKIIKEPSIWVENGKEAQFTVKGKGYELELVIRPQF